MTDEIVEMLKNYRDLDDKDFKYILEKWIKIKNENQELNYTFDWLIKMMEGD